MEISKNLLPLSEFCDSVDYGYTTSAIDDPKGVRFLRITDIVGNGINWKDVPFCIADNETKQKYKLYHDDIVIARTGATTGYSAYIKQPPESVFASYLVRLRVNKSNNSRFVSYLLKSEYFWDHMRGVLGDKSAQPNASASTMAQAILPRPPLPTQRAIAHILGTLDDKIELLRSINETLEAMARALFKSWFVDFDPVRKKAEGQPTGLPPEIDALFPDSFENSELGEIPRGWKVEPLSKWFGFLPGYAFKSKDWQESGVPVIKIGSVKPGFVDLSQVSFVSTTVATEAYRYRLKTADLVIGMTGYVGEVGLVPITDNLPLLNQRVGKFLLNKDGTAELGFLYCLTRRNEFKISVETHSHGTAQANVSADGIMSIKAVFPSKPIYAIFNKECQALLNQLILNKHEMAILERTRDSLLPKLISGDLELSDQMIKKILEPVI